MKTNPHEDAVIAQAMAILKQKLANRQTSLPALQSHEEIAKLAILTCGALQHEEFWCMFFNKNQAMIEFRLMAVGTLNECPVYPREFAKHALNANASFAIFVHNHPNGKAYPSTKDTLVNKMMAACFCAIDVVLLDHLIVAGDDVYSMADYGLMPELEPI